MGWAAACNRSQPPTETVRQAPLLPASEDGVQRLFFALWPGSALRGEIARCAESMAREHRPAGRALDSGRYHLTLQFLGDFQPLPPAVMDAAITAASAVHSPAFDLVLDRAGSFPGSRVWWLGPSHSPHGLTQLWNALAGALARGGVRVRSPSAFTPHLTIRRDAPPLGAALPIDPMHWPVREFVLIASQPGHPYVVPHRQALDGLPPPAPQ